MEKKTLSVDETAKALGISRGLAYKAVKSGEIPSIRIGGRFLISKETLQKILQVKTNQRTD